VKDVTVNPNINVVVTKIFFIMLQHLGLLNRSF
jgi:hypothetical protein